MYAFKVSSVFGMKKEENPLRPSPRNRPKKELDLRYSAGEKPAEGTVFSAVC
jgi:hypothetical protein